MTDSEQRGGEAVDRLVRGYLDREAARIDSTALLARIRTTRLQAEGAEGQPGLPRRAERSTRGSWLHSLAWCLSTAAAVIVAFLGGRHLGSDSASAAVVLQQVQAAHSGPIDRCYRVQYAPDPRSWNGKNKLEGPSQSILWTRGDRFWADCTIGDVQLKLGREADGALWISPSPKKGVRFSTDEARLPREVALICAINAMSVPRLVQDVLADFDLRADGPAGDTHRSRTVVWATLKPGRSHPLLSHALLEIDENDVLTRLVLWMVRDGRPRGTVTFTLLESSPRTDELYQLTSHLNADATIETQVFQPAAGKP